MFGPYFHNSQRLSYFYFVFFICFVFLIGKGNCIKKKRYTRHIQSNQRGASIQKLAIAS